MSKRQRGFVDGLIAGIGIGAALITVLHMITRGIT
jgi:hypothetical protein